MKGKAYLGLFLAVIMSLLLFVPETQAGYDAGTDKDISTNVVIIAPLSVSQSGVSFFSVNYRAYPRHYYRYRRTYCPYGGYYRYWQGRYYYSCYRYPYRRHYYPRYRY